MSCSTAPSRRRCSTSAAARGCSSIAGPYGSARMCAWSARSAPNLEYRTVDAKSLPFVADEFDLASAIEVLEHVPQPERTLAEMARCARSHLLVSVPREPLWRALNLARGAYVRQLGNTPGHLNHFSKRSFQ